MAVFLALFCLFITFGLLAGVVSFFHEAEKEKARTKAHNEWIVSVRKSRI